MFTLSTTYSAHNSSNQKLSQKNTNSLLTQTHIKPKIHKHQTQHFRRISPFGIAPVKSKQTNEQTNKNQKKNKKTKKQVRLGYAGIVDHSVDLSIPDF